MSDNTIKTLELQLSNGDYIIGRFNIDKIYNVRQITRSRFSFSSKFPFVKIEKENLTKFRYRTVYGYINDYRDARYCIKCSIAAFMDMLGMDYESFSEHVIDSVVKRGY